MPLMGSLYVGASGLQTSQNALNTTSHNLSNLDTVGYVRQQVLLGDRTYSTVGNSSISSQQVGLGVNYEKVRQVRDFFLDQTYREEKGRAAFYETSYDVINEIETLFGEMEGVAFQTSLSDLWTAVQELQKDPSSTVVQGQLVSKAATFIERANSVYSGLSSYQSTLNDEVKDIVGTINKYGNQISALNEQIRKLEIGSEEANDLRDQRNQLLDELSGYANISYDEDQEGVVSVKIEGSTFIARDRVYEMGTVMDPGTGFYTPVWPQNSDTPVFDLTKEISSDLDSDIGKLKALVLARGDHAANYSDMDDKDTYERDIQPSLIMNIQAEFDNLIHGVVTTMNNVLCGETNPDATLPTYDSAEDCPHELFVRLGTERYKEVTDPTDPDYGKYRYVAEDTSGSPSNVSSMYTSNNLKINPDLLKQASLLSFVNADGTVDKEKANALEQAFDNTFDTLNPTLEAHLNFKDYYSALIGQVANEGSVYKNIAQTQAKTVISVDDAREAVMGVSSDEELTNMIKFQNAYNASSRYINVISDMLETLLNLK
ncbi:MAG: flagellar hook-associated protein FlgK [bacterium]|nr:flagellar hook-associated protein FlgK [bacterium]